MAIYAGQSKCVRLRRARFEYSEIVRSLDPHAKFALKLYFRSGPLTPGPMHLNGRNGVFINQLGLANQ